jgi:dolichol kinase
MKKTKKKINSEIDEWHRQIFHILFGVVLVGLLMFGFIDKGKILLLIIVGILISLLSRGTRLPIIYYFLEKFERKKDLEKFPGKGVIFYLVGSYLSLLLFSKDIALAAIMVLAFGDSISHAFGLHFGKIKHPLSSKKFLEGTIAGFLAGFIGAMVFLPWHEALFASLAAMIVEAIEIKIKANQVDDNISIPLVAGAVVWLIRFI